MKTAVIVGATGDAGRGIVTALVADGYRVVAVARSAERLASLAREFPDRVVPLAGSISTEDAAAATQAAVRATVRQADAVVISVSGPKTSLDAIEVPFEQWERVFRENLWPQIFAVQYLLPLVSAGGTYLTLGGGLADAVVPGRSHMSMCQAAQRAFIRSVAAAPAAASVHVRELMIRSVISGDSNRQTAKAAWITDMDVGQHVSAILRSPDSFESVIVNLNSRDQVGRLDPPRGGLDR